MSFHGLFSHVMPSPEELKRLQIESMWREKFRDYDEDGSEEIDVHELCDMFKWCEIGEFSPSDHVIKKLMEQMDTDGDGTISFPEFIDFMRDIETWQDMDNKMKSAATKYGNYKELVDNENEYVKEKIVNHPWKAIKKHPLFKAGTVGAAIGSGKAIKVKDCFRRYSQRQVSAHTTGELQIWELGKGWNSKTGERQSTGGMPVWWQQGEDDDFWWNRQEQPTSWGEDGYWSDSCYAFPAYHDEELGVEVGGICAMTVMKCFDPEDELALCDIAVAHKHTKSEGRSAISVGSFHHDSSRIVHACGIHYVQPEYGYVTDLCSGNGHFFASTSKGYVIVLTRDGEFVDMQVANKNADYDGVHQPMSIEFKSHAYGMSFKPEDGLVTASGHGDFALLSFDPNAPNPNSVTKHGVLTHRKQGRPGTITCDGVACNHASFGPEGYVLNGVVTNGNAQIWTCGDDMMAKKWNSGSIFAIGSVASQTKFRRDTNLLGAGKGQELTYIMPQLHTDDWDYDLKTGKKKQRFFGQTLTGKDDTPRLVNTNVFCGTKDGKVFLWSGEERTFLDKQQGYRNIRCTFQVQEAAMAEIRHISKVTRGEGEDKEDFLVTCSEDGIYVYPYVETLKEQNPFENHFNGPVDAEAHHNAY